MGILKKWKIKYKIYAPLKIEIKRFKLREESKYRLCLYKLLIYKLIIYINYNYSLWGQCFVKHDYHTWRESIGILNIINKYISFNKPYNKGNKKIFKRINKQSFLTVIHKLYYLNYSEYLPINRNIYNINYLFKINSLIDLLLWIHYTDINLNLLMTNGKIFNILEKIKRHQENCRNMEYYYNNTLFDNNIQIIFNDIKYILLNYKFII